jgi:hypothetical protein
LQNLLGVLADHRCDHRLGPMRYDKSGGLETGIFQEAHRRIGQGLDLAIIRLDEKKEETTTESETNRVAQVRTLGWYGNSHRFTSFFI